jgi:hypothetical protein
VATVSVILQGKQGVERHIMKQIAIATGVSIWKQAPHLRASDIPNDIQNDSERTAQAPRRLK